MDPTRFDRLAHSFAHTASRRRVLGGLAASAVAALGFAAAPTVAARPHRKRCKLDADCKATQQCANGTCVTGRGTCSTGADSCAGHGLPFCLDASGKHQCVCFSRLEDGSTRCGYFGNKSACDQCQTDADCHALGFPRGTSCTQDFGVNCPVCQNDDKGTCIVPCGLKDPT